MGYVSSNMIGLYGPLTWIFIGFLLAITGCVILIESPDLPNAAYALFLVAGILVALAAVTLANEGA
jgi:fucose permease